MALANYQQAHTICEKEDDSFSVLSLNKKMAAAYRKLGDHDKALELLYDILEHYRLTSNPKGAVEVLVLIADTYNERGDKAGAADAYRSVSNIHKRFKHARLAEDVITSYSIHYTKLYELEGHFLSRTIRKLC